MASRERAPSSVWARFGWTSDAHAPGTDMTISARLRGTPMDSHMPRWALPYRHFSYMKGWYSPAHFSFSHEWVAPHRSPPHLSGCRRRTRGSESPSDRPPIGWNGPPGRTFVHSPHAPHPV